MATVILGNFNTVSLAAGTVARLKGPLGMNRAIAVLNIGPGTVFLRADDDPAVGDQFSLRLPPGFGLNEVPVDASGIGVISDGVAKLSVAVQ
jgi:hypothetical protein